jgi:hypothetical protein
LPRIEWLGRVFEHLVLETRESAPIRIGSLDNQPASLLELVDDQLGVKCLLFSEILEVDEDRKVVYLIRYRHNASPPKENIYRSHFFWISGSPASPGKAAPSKPDAM